MQCQLESLRLNTSEKKILTDFFLIVCGKTETLKPDLNMSWY